MRAEPFEGYPHVLSTKQFTLDDVRRIKSLAEAIRSRPEKFADALYRRRAQVAFQGESTRTFNSSYWAAYDLGAKVVGNQAMGIMSSDAKGESFPDTIRTLARLNLDYLFLRWSHEGAASEAVYYLEEQAKKRGKRNTCSVINSGDGPGEHPTQALLDLTTILDHFPDTTKQIVVAIIGDLKRGRTTHSLTYLLAKNFPNISFFLLSPEEAMMKSGVIEYLDEHRRHFCQVTRPNFYAIASGVDVWYVTRPQLNLEDDPDTRARMIKEYQPFIFQPEIVPELKAGSIIMHPLPRTFELPDDPAIMDYPGFVAFDQVENGYWIRMALLVMIENAKINLFAESQEV